MNEKITQIVAVDIIPNAIASGTALPIVALDRTADIALTGEPSLNPMAVYLSQLSPSSRRTMRGALETIAKIVSAGEFDAINFPWADLRYQHTQAIDAQLTERYALSNANKMMAALSRVLEEAWKLGLMSAEDYHRAIASSTAVDNRH